jgi:predicted signal transduction protein with EAL and GGDEF domain
VARSLSAANIRDGVWVPLRGEPGVVGLIGVINREGEVRGFDRADQLLLETVAAHTAIALQNGRLIDQLRFEASHDVLTGLPNRAFLHSAMQQAIADQASGHRIGIMIMDLDGFKEVNETLGHEQGDVLLQHVADRLRVAAPPSTVVARLGGDEFAIWCRTPSTPCTWPSWVGACSRRWSSRCACSRSTWP